MVKRGVPPGLSVPVRVRPGAGRTRVGGRYEGPHGPALIVAVGAPAVDGQATEAVRRALAAALRVRPADVELRLGATSRDKVFTVATAGDDTTAGLALTARLAEIRDGSPAGNGRAERAGGPEPARRTERDARAERDGRAERAGGPERGGRAERDGRAGQGGSA